VPGRGRRLSASKGRGRLFLPNGLLEELEAEAQNWAPRETGGMLLGYHIDNGGATHELVVIDTVDAGPRARRRRWWFAPDGPWQQEQLERVYRSSGRVGSYLGDWHSHPRGRPRPSMLDRRTYARVAAEPETGTARPLVLILAVGSTLAVGAYLVDRHRELIDLDVTDYSA
jgi:integrative and conjugative element protein (TIGR02256 family)